MTGEWWQIIRSSASYRCIFTQFSHLYTPYTSPACLLLFKVAKPEPEPETRVWKLSSWFGIPSVYTYVLIDFYNIWRRVLRKYATRKLLICPPQSSLTYIMLLDERTDGQNSHRYTASAIAEHLVIGVIVFSFYGLRPKPPPGLYPCTHWFHSRIPLVLPVTNF